MESLKRDRDIEPNVPDNTVTSYITDKCKYRKENKLIEIEIKMKSANSRLC